MQVKVWLIFGYVNQRAQPNKSMDARRKQLLSFGVVRYPDVACIRFPPASSQPLNLFAENGELFMSKIRNSAKNLTCHWNRPASGVRLTAAVKRAVQLCVGRLT